MEKRFPETSSNKYEKSKLSAKFGTEKNQSVFMIWRDIFSTFRHIRTHDAQKHWILDENLLKSLNDSKLDEGLFWSQ